ncbi:hypothetical protein KVR01_010713 [Diaporthe batatas]|uniref:uncharacterized protein n=1 Tax=Diaporthe batatas TaxID=748121 RepID=UPI001D050724|nr:uncharacterized protein KVR01_010713 [Diaporthe batatas]KAG8160076.1 hypothetical protein KVR01_010713 [Diaporthe batatas]
MLAQDHVKLNRYHTLSDCENDRDILYHGAPVSGKCYELNDQAGPLVTITEVSGSLAVNTNYDKHGCDGT